MTRIKFLFWSLVFSVGCFSALAYPPGPYTVLYGTVRDQYGSLVTASTAQVVLQSPGGAQFTTPIIAGGSMPGVNYLLKVPLDSDATADLYQPNVLSPAATYQLLVIIGKNTYVPIEISTNYLSLGTWANSTRVDLTIGADSNHDGIPDGWEYNYLASLGLSLALSQINANSILSTNGLTVKQQYVLGTALLDPNNPLNITFMGFTSGYPALQFPTVTGRTYIVQGSADLKTWSTVPFRLTSQGVGGAAQSNYLAPSVATIQIYVNPPGLGNSRQFYRIQVQ